MCCRSAACDQSKAMTSHHANKQHANTETEEERKNECTHVQSALINQRTMSLEERGHFFHRECERA